MVFSTARGSRRPSYGYRLHAPPQTHAAALRCQLARPAGSPCFKRRLRVDECAASGAGVASTTTSSPAASTASASASAGLACTQVVGRKSGETRLSNGYCRQHQLGNSMQGCLVWSPACWPAWHWAHAVPATRHTRTRAKHTYRRMHCPLTCQCMARSLGQARAQAQGDAQCPDRFGDSCLTCITVRAMTAG